MSWDLVVFPFIHNDTDLYFIVEDFGYFMVSYYDYNTSNFVSVFFTTLDVFHFISLLEDFVFDVVS